MNRRRHLIRFLIPMLLTSMLLVSCIGIDSTVQFKRDGSGILYLQYRFSRELTDLGGLEGDVPFPVTEEDFHFAMEGKEGLKLRKYKRKMDEEDITIHAEILFESIDTFSSLAGFQDMPMSLTKQDGEYVFQQKIVEARIEEDAAAQTSAESGPAIPDEELLALFFEGYEMSFTVRAPSRITYHSLGELARNEKSVTYAIPLLELNRQTEALVLTVKWED